MNRILLLLNIILLFNSLAAQTTIDAVTYNAAIGEFTLTGSGFDDGVGVDATKIKITGGSNKKLVLTSVTGVTTYTNTIKMTVDGIDRAGMNWLLNADGTQSSQGTTYNLKTTVGWNGTSGSVNTAGITVSNYTPPQITSATYDASTGNLVVTGTSLANKTTHGDDIEASKLIILENGGESHQLTNATSNNDVSDYELFTLTIAGADKTAIDQIIDQNGTSSIAGNNYYIHGLENWNIASTGTDADNGNNPIVASNVITITGVNYNASSGTLLLTGTEFDINANIEPTLLTITGQGGASYTLTSATSAAKPMNSTMASLTINGIDRAYINVLLNNDGTTSVGSTTYTLDASTGWNGGSTPARHGIGITVSNYTTPQITSATYDASTGIMVIRGSGFTSDAGANNDIDVSMLTITGYESGTHTLSQGVTSDVDVTNDTEITITIVGSDKTQVDNLLDINGTTSSDGIDYNLEGANGWNTPSITTHGDVGPNSITVSNNSVESNATASETEICTGQTIVLYANPSGGSSSYTYSWSSNTTSFTSTNENPSVTPSLTSVYTVVVDDGSETTSSSISITVNPIPQLTTTVDTTICSTVSLNYIAESDIVGTSFSWTRNTVANITEVGTTGSDAGISEILTNTINKPVQVSYTYNLSAAGCSNNESVIITVNPGGQVDIPTDQIICVGDKTDYVNLSTSNIQGTTTYAWVNDNTNTGLGTSGSGNIPAFTTTNANTSQEVSNITITPTFEYNAVSCVGESEEFQYMINPAPQVNQPSDQVLCADENSAPINFSTINTDGLTNYSWINSNTSVGLQASGTGSVPTFIAINNETFPQSATITVTPEYINNGKTCSGDSKSFVITVNPKAQVNPVNDQEICHNDDFTEIEFSTINVLGTVRYEWVNNNTTIGLSASGTGNIPSFTGLNLGIDNDTATITVTPYYKYNGHECEGTTIQFNLIVKPLPVVNFSMPQSTYRNDAPADTIHGAIPHGGIFSGPGIIAVDSTFHPSSAGDGNHTISYTYPASSTLGCQNIVTDNVSVVPPGGTITGVKEYYCDYEDFDTIYGHVDQGGTLTQPGCGFKLIPGMTLINKSVAVINPSLLDKGDIEIKFTYYKGTYFDIIANTTIHEIKDITSMSGLLDEYCLNSESSNLVGNPLGGTFYVSGTINSDIFNPNIFGPGTSNVEYIYNISGTNCYDTTQASTIIHNLSDISLTYDTAYCANSPQVPIVGNQGDGIFTGPNLSGSGDTVYFLPSASIVGEHTITYQYTDGNGCINTTSQPLIVNAVATVGIETIDPILCVDADSVQLIGEIFGVVQNQGLFFGQGIYDADITDGVAYFHPDIAEPGGPYNITYLYTDQNGCEATHTSEVSIQGLPEVSINNLDQKYCVGESPVYVEGFPKNANGAFQYSGENADFDDNGDGSALFFPNNTIQGGIITYTYTDNEGCSNSATETVDIMPLPVVSFESDTIFCPNQDPVEIIGQPLGGVFAGPNLSGTDTVTFAPNFLIIGTHHITYTYSDENGCQNLVNREIEVVNLPLLGINSLNEGYCIDASEIQITGLVNGANASSGYFSGSLIIDENENDGHAYFYPDMAENEGSHEVIFTYTDENSCVNTYHADVEIYELPSLSIYNLDELYCEGDVAVTVSGVPENNNGQFSYTGSAGDLIDNGNGTALFEPTNVITEGVVTYLYTDENGCSNSTKDTVTVSPLPTVNFSVESFCVGDTIHFVDESTSGIPLNQWAWNFGDPLSDDNTSALQNPKHFYEVPGEKDIQLSVTTTHGCSSSLMQTISFDNSPDVDFIWENECAGIGSTKFMNLSNDSTTVLWNFGDGETSTLVSPSHSYSTEGAFNVMLFVTNSSGCESHITKMINVRPYIQNFPYIEDFEGETSGGWLADALVEESSWEFGTPNGVVIDHALNGDNVWCTGLSGNYYDAEQSAIVSPCFDFSKFKKPMIKLDIWVAAQENADGAVLQAKVVGETDWINVGNPDDAVNWYNGVGLTGNPGGNSNIGSYGWTGVDTSWIDARHKLDFLVGKENVRFRIAFGSDNGGNNDGFAFDNLRIGDRTKLALIESFTNNSSLQSAQINDDLNALLEDNPLDIVDIQFHTSFPDEDVFNEHNPADPSARLIYYGVSTVPWAVVNGNKFSGNTAYVVNNAKLFDELSLQDPLFKIDVETTKTDSRIDVATVIKAQRPIETSNLTVYTAIVERKVTEVTAPNGETVFVSVLKKMLPNAAGTFLNRAWSSGQTEHIDLYWNYTNVYNPEQLETIVFIQNEDTREVYQAMTDDTTVNQVNINSIMLDMQEQPFMVFPNPTNGNFTVLLSSRLPSDGTMYIYNSMGEIIQQKEISRGEYSLCETLNATPGMYFIRIQYKGNVLGVERLIVE